MRQSSPESRRQRHSARGPATGSGFRLGLEPLEDRTLPDAAFGALATEVNKRLTTLETGLSAVTTAAQLPVLDTTINAVAADAQKALKAFREDIIVKELGKLDSTKSDVKLQEELYKLLSSLGVLHNNSPNDVKVERNASGLTIKLNVGKAVPVTKAFTLGLGLPGVPLRIDTGPLKVDAGFAYDNLVFGIGPDGKTPFFDTATHRDEFQVTVEAKLDPATVNAETPIEGSLGFLRVTATDAGGTRLTVGLAMDVQGNSWESMTLTGTKLIGHADVNLNVVANVKTASLAATAQYPSVSTQFRLHWDLTGSKPDAPRNNLGLEPSIQFRDVTINLGTFLSRVLGPVVATMRDFMRPFDPLLRIITTEIPGLSDISKAADLGPVTLESLAKVLGQSGALPPDYKLLFDLSAASISLHKLLIDVNTDKKSLEINVGSFSLDGNDVRTPGAGSLTSANLNDLIPKAVGAVRSIADQLKASTPPELKPIFDEIDKRLRSAQNGAGFSFPLFDDPMAGVFRFLLGQNVDFVNYTARFHFDAYQTELIPLPFRLPLIPDFVKARLNGQIDVDVYLKVGYDTYGLRNFLKTLQSEGVVKPSLLLNGLYFDASEPLLKMSGSISVGAAIELRPVPFVPVLTPLGPVPVVPNVSVNGQLSAEHVTVGFNSGSDRFRLLEKAPRPLFNTAGLIKAAFTFVVEAGIPGVAARELYKEVLKDTVLFDLYNGPHANPSNPFIPPPGEPILADIEVDLNRPLKAGPAHLGAPGNDGTPDFIDVFVQDGYVQVLVNGITAIQPNGYKLSGVGKILIRGSRDDDFLTVYGDLNKPVTFEGRGGTNSLTMNDLRGGLVEHLVRYTVTGGKMNRETVSAGTGQTTRAVSVDFTSVAHLTLYPAFNTELVEVTVDSLRNHELDLILGATRTLVTVDTTSGGFADTVNVSHFLDFGEVPQTSLLVRDRNVVGDDALLYSGAAYEITRDHLTRTKRLPMRLGGGLFELGVSGTTTINYSGIDELSVKGGDLGNTFDVQGTARGTRYKLTGGTGTDRFVIGQVHHNLSGGTGAERQLGFADTNIAIDGVGGFTDSLVLDDTGSDYLHPDYLPRNTYVVGGKAVSLFTTVDAPEGPVTTGGTYDYTNIQYLTIRGGGRNEFLVFDTASLRFGGLIELAQTTIVGGANADLIAVLGTTGPLFFDAGGGTNQVLIGVPGALGKLDNIRGDIFLTGRAPGAVNSVSIEDGANPQPSSYFMNADVFWREGTAAVYFGGMAVSGLHVQGGGGGNSFRIDDTPIMAQGGAVHIAAGGSDAITVTRTTGPLHLTAVGQTRIDVGNSTSSLDTIRGRISIFPSTDNLMKLRMIDMATTTSRAFLVYGTDSSQTYQRTNEGGTELRTLVEVINVPIRNVEYLGGSGGTSVYLDSTPFNTHTTFVGHVGALDVFAIGWARDMNKVLGRVSCFGQAADNDFAYYYDYLNPNPQAFYVRTLFGTMIVGRPGIAEVQYGGLAQVIFYTPLVGGNTVDVRGVTAPTHLNLAVGKGDVVTLGANPNPNLGGSLAFILGPVSVGSYGNPDGTRADVTLIVDNSGNVDLTPRRAELYTSPGTHLVGLAPAAMHWHIGANSTVSIRGGAADETFAMRDTAFLSPTSIDGGGGVNSLDYSALTSDIYANLQTGTATGLRGGIADIRNVIGGAGNDILVGNGGNILDGRAGRDILIAGPAGDVPGVVARYRADNGNATDSFGGHHGTVHGGVTFGPGYRGQGFGFNGIDAYVRVPNAPDLEPATVTVEAWVRATAPGRNAYIVSKGALGDVAASYAIYTGANAGLQFYIGEGTTFALSPDAGPGVWDGQWHHVAGTFDGSVVRLFVDGVEVGAGTLTSLRIGYGRPDSNDLFIGSYNRGYLFNGSIDEVVIHGRALAAAEILASRYNFLDGPPSSVLIGGGGEDLLIAGTTAFDLDPAALALIQAEWTRTDLDYETRVANLTTNDGTPGPKLTAETVRHNGGVNVLSGGAGRDLFFGSIGLLDFADNDEDEFLIWI